MSVQDIVKYVRQTPGNTNPSVIASMVNAEVSSTLEEAKKYTDSQRLAYESIEMLVNDGSIPGQDLFGEGILFAKISDTPIDAGTITAIRAIALDGSANTTFPIASLFVRKTPELTVVSLTPAESDDHKTEHILVIILNNAADGFTPGVYVHTGGAGGRVAEVKYKAVKQIDPKFIPDPFPKIRLTNTVSIPDEQNPAPDITLTVEEKSLFETLYQNYNCLSIEVNFDHAYTICFLCTHVSFIDDSGDHGFCGVQFVEQLMALNVQRVNGEWEAYFIV